ncbi:reprolysin-like metallopeptidase [Paucihalobacter sp.]|uniref:reprolysin-like metallopeptidase n=1 Tax=Paucihalobacter sp. TaxID=2850405 RepID=UPI002FE31CE8
MKKNYIKILFTVLFVLLFSIIGLSQSASNLWKPIDPAKAQLTEQILRKAQPYQAQYFQLNLESLKSTLQAAPYRLNTNVDSNVIISLPNSLGDFDNFKIMEANIIDEELQRKYPNIRSYVGQGVDNPSLFLRFSLSPFGLHTMTLGSHLGVQYIDPFSKQGDIYIVYSKRHLNPLENPHVCEVEDEFSEFNRNEIFDLNQARNANDGTLREYRMALACTEEYAAFHVNQAGLNAAPDAQKKAAVLAAMNVTMTRVNGIYERDLSVTMTIIPNNEIIIFLTNDPFDNNNAGTLINQSQSVIDSNIGNANYDIGHTFSTGGGGLASLNVPCVSGSKARGITGSFQPLGDPFDVDFVAHEIGHQFGSPHTFNGTQGNCSGNNRTASSAYEPGSGTTIMAYAGICGSDNIQNNSDAYFHQRSLALIWANVSSGNSSSCPTQTSTGNSSPTANAGANYIIPAGTPYKLTGSSTDANGTASHTYTWEQYDLGPAGLPAETNLQGPLVRSFEGSTNPTRYIPRLEDILINGGTSSTWEKLSLVTRQINYRLTVRDNDPRGGQIAVDNMIVTNNNAAAFFRVTSQNTTGITWTPGETETVTWDVANTNGVDINTQNVNILLSTDGGQNFDVVLASNTPNDGTQDIIVPDVFGVNCRIMVEAVGNIFFNVNAQSFTVGSLTCADYASDANLGIAIPDGSGTTGPIQGTAISHQINVPDNVVIDQVSVSVNVSHTWVGDILILVEHPDGTTASVVWSGNCGNNDNINVTFQDGAPAIVCGSPTSGTYAPVESLSVFNGLNSQGNWTIRIADFFAGDTGTLNNWSLEICTSSSLSIADNEFNNLQVFPNPNNGTFNVSFIPQSENVKIDVYDIRGRAILSKTYQSNGRFEETLTLDNAQSGMYLLSITDGNQKVTKKIIVD